MNGPVAREIEDLNIPALVEDEIFRFDTVLKFDRPELNAIRDIWQSKLAGRPIAARADFDARTLKPYMRNMGIIEVVPQPDGSRRYRQRYEGSAIVEVFGEQTGKFVDEYIPPNRFARWRAAHDLVALSGRPLRFIVNYASQQISFLRSEIFLMPLAEDGANVNMIMFFNYFGPKQL
jgi:hypothetical protein